MRLIDADSLIEKINKVYAVEEKEDLKWAKGLHYVKAIIRDMATIETDASTMLKEQEAVQWINVKDKLPEKDGQYLVVYTFFDYKSMGVVRFSHNLHEIDEYNFDTERPGWYEPDDEVGYIEWTTVTHWAKLPKFPKEGR